MVQPPPQNLGQRFSRLQNRGFATFAAEPRYPSGYPFSSR